MRVSQFTNLANRYAAEAERHRSMARNFVGSPQFAAQHDRLAALARDSAKEANDAAAMHQQLAGIAR